MKLVIIANPVAGGGRAYRQIQTCLQHWRHPDWKVEILTTRNRDHAGLFAEELLHDPPDVLAVCGGDGTINEVASRVPRPPFPIALLPAGTANVVARELRIPLDPVRALQIAISGSVRRVDLGELGAGARRFLFVAGIGFDACVVAKTNPQLKKKIGMAAYAAAIIFSLRNYSFPEFRVVTEDRSYTATSCLACNAKSYGGGLLFCPEADMSDGLLDVLVLEKQSRAALARFLLQAWRGKAEARQWIHRLRARSLQIEGGAGALIQADGELAGSPPVKISLTHAAFPIVVPEKL